MVSYWDYLPEELRQMILRYKHYLEWRDDKIQCIVNQLKDWQNKMTCVETKEEFTCLTQEGNCLRAHYCTLVYGWNPNDFWTELRSR